MADKSPEQELEQKRARLAISQKYLNRDDNPDLDPSHQDQLDKNRIPGELGAEQLSPNSARKNARERPARVRSNQTSKTLSDALNEPLRRRPYASLALVGVVGFVIGALWKS